MIRVEFPNQLVYPTGNRRIHPSFVGLVDQVPSQKRRMAPIALDGRFDCLIIRLGLLPCVFAQLEQYLHTLLGGRIHKLGDFLPAELVEIVSGVKIQPPHLTEHIGSQPIEPDGEKRSTVDEQGPAELVYLYFSLSRSQFSNLNFQRIHGTGRIGPMGDDPVLAFY